jgi:hypothetical protein
MHLLIKSLDICWYIIHCIVGYMLDILFITSLDILLDVVNPVIFFALRVPYDVKPTMSLS